MTWVDSSLLVAGAALTALVLVGLSSHARRRRLLAEFLGGRRAMARLSRLDLYRLGLRRAVLLSLAGIALAVAAAEPRWQDPPAPPPPPLKRAVLAIDVSASMQAEDEAPTRLAVATAAADSALTALAGHEVGLLVFAGTTYALAPPTLDHAAIRYLLGGLVPRLASAQDPGTLISHAIDESLALLEHAPSATPGEAAPRPETPEPPVARADGERLVVVLSDGDAGEQAEDVAAAVERAREAGVAVHAIGVGTEAGAGMSMPAGTYQLGGPVVDARGVPGRSRLREPLLQQLASDGGGAYAHTGAEGDLRTLHVALADLGPQPEPVVDASTPLLARYDLSSLLGVVALVLVALESLMSVSLPVLRAVRRREAA